MIRVSLIALICSVSMAGPFEFANAQTFPIYGNSGRIGILDREALFTQSAAGKSILSTYEEKAKQLASENKEIQAQLEKEELELTETRKSMDATSFNLLATTFDEKVKKIRAEQSNKERVLNLTLNQNRTNFFERLSPILQKFIEANGIEVVLKKETVVLSTSGRDITQAAIQRIDEMLK
jgi:Skp family chaperone for outer membrane proteins